MTVEREDKAHGLVHQCIRWDYVRKSEVSSFRWLVLSDRTRDNRHKQKYKKHVLAVSVSKHWNRMSKELVGSLLLLPDVSKLSERGLGKSALDDFA